MPLNFDEFKNKNIIVTGSSTGIGLHTALEFLKLGAKVVFHGNNSIKNLNETIESQTNSQNYKIIKSNFIDPKEVEKFLKDAIDYLGDVDILINNAGTMVGRYSIDKINESQFDEIFSLNAKSAFFITKKIIDIFKNKKSGCIVNVSTISARTGGSAGSSVYAASKAFISGITRSLVSECSPYNIRINAISPGTIDTKFHEQYSTKEKLEKTKQKIPMQRLGTPQDCVGPIIFLCSEKLSGYITGQILEINGGQFIS